MKLFNFVEKAYYINLESRQDKKIAIENHFKEIGISEYVERFNAVTPYDFDAKPDINGIFKHNDTSKACLYSHLAIIELAKQKNLNNVLIFEDDARFYTKSDYSFNDVIVSAIESLNELSKWDVLFLGTNSGTRESTLEQYGENLVKTPESIGTHAVLINSTVYDTILHNAKNQYAFDIFLSTFFTDKFLVYPMVVYQNHGTLNDVGQNFTGYNEEWWANTYKKTLIKMY